MEKKKKRDHIVVETCACLCSFLTLFQDTWTLTWSTTSQFLVWPNPVRFSGTFFLSGISFYIWRWSPLLYEASGLMKEKYRCAVYNLISSNINQVFHTLRPWSSLIEEKFRKSIRFPLFYYILLSNAIQRGMDSWSNLKKSKTYFYFIYIQQQMASIGSCGLSLADLFH